MEYDLDTGSHSTDSLHYHLVLVVKYEGEVFNEELRDFLREVVSGFVDNYGVLRTAVVLMCSQDAASCERREPAGA